MSKRKMFSNNRNYTQRGNLLFALKTLDDFEFREDNKPFYVECQALETGNKATYLFSTLGYRHFLTRESASDFCYEVADGVVDMQSVIKASSAARKTNDKERAEKQLKLAELEKSSFVGTACAALGGDTASTNRLLYNLLWEFDNMSGKAKSMVLAELSCDKDGASHRRVEVTLPTCGMCQHYFGDVGGRKCFEKERKGEDVFCVAPASLVRDGDCQSFLPRGFRWYGSPRTPHTFCSVFCGDVKLGDVLVHAFFTEDDEDTANAAKREILLGKLFEKQLADISMSTACISDLNLVIRRPKKEEV